MYNIITNFNKMMRSPKNASNPDLTTRSTSDNDLKISLRKRKQPESDLLDAFTSLQSNITKTLNEFRSDLHNKIDKLNDNINNVKSDLEVCRSEIRSEMAVLRTRQTEFQQQVTNLAQEYQTLQNSAQFISDQHDEIKKSMSEIKENSARINTNESTVLLLREKINTLEQQARQCNLEISNVPEKREENLLNIMASIGAQIGCAINHRDIVSVHRVPHAVQNKKPKNIIVKLTTRILRDNILSAYRLKKGLTSTQIDLSGAPHIIYINEHLTLQNKQLFHAARVAIKQENFKFVWVKHSTIFVRESENSPVVTIRTEKDLQKIKSRQSNNEKSGNY